MQRGEVWWASLPPASGSQPGYRRPVLIVQADEFNASRIGTVVAVAITSSTRLAEAPGNVLLRQKDSHLPKESVANVSEIVTLDKRFLTEPVGRLPSRTMRKVETGLRLVLSL